MATRSLGKDHSSYRSFVRPPARHAEDYRSCSAGPVTSPNDLGTTLPHVRRQLNQGFFTKLFIARDGSIERAELTEPFVSLMDHELGAPDWQTGGGAQNVLEGLDLVRTTETLPLPPDGARGVLGRERTRPGNVLVRTFGNDLEYAHGDLITVGSKEAGLVPAVGFEPTLAGS